MAQHDREGCDVGTDWPPVDPDECHVMYDGCKSAVLAEEQSCGPADGEGDHDYDGVPNKWDSDHPDYGKVRTEYIHCGQALGGDALCVEGRCILQEEVYDLYVGEISDPVVSKGCQNYVTFEICNGGLGTVSGPFDLTVESGTTVVPWTFTGTVAPGACVLFEQPSLMHIMNLGIALGETAEVTVTLDVGDDVVETNEANNIASAAIRERMQPATAGPTTL